MDEWKRNLASSLWKESDISSLSYKQNTTSSWEDLDMEYISRFEKGRRTKQYL